MCLLGRAEALEPKPTLCPKTQENAQRLHGLPECLLARSQLRSRPPASWARAPKCASGLQRKSEDSRDVPRRLCPELRYPLHQVGLVAHRRSPASVSAPAALASSRPGFQRCAAQPHGQFPLRLLPNRKSNPPCKKQSSNRRRDSPDPAPPSLLSLLWSGKPQRAC